MSKRQYYDDLPQDTEYLPIDGWPKYLISSIGEVWSNKGNRWLRRRNKTCTTNNVPYQCVILTKGSERRNFFVHDLVLTAWAGKRPVGYVCRHLDGNPRNNTPNNLVWGTYAENNRDKKRHGKTAYGSKNSMAKLTLEQVREIRRRRASGEKLTEIAKDFGVGFQNISSIANGQRWTDVRLV